MKISELRKAQKYLTSSATDKVKPNSKPDVKSSEQDSKPARFNFIVNPVTGNYENTAYSIQQSIDKHTEFSPAQKAAFTEFYSKDDRIADEAKELQKEKKLSGYQPHKRVAAAANFYPTVAIPEFNLAPLVEDLDTAEQQITARKKYEQTIINPDANEGIAGILINKNRRKI